MSIKLDIWHFMRRIAIGCTTDAHPLYGVFMGRLSQCIFQWSSEDIKLLIEAKRSEILTHKITPMIDGDVLSGVTKKELSLHCRRQTRGVKQTEALITDLLTTFSGDQGRDSLGVPLIDSSKIWDIWEQQKRHIPCIQDPDDIELYTKTGTIKKGQCDLPILCARGSTSFESFHLHLNRFIPGASASDTHFQAYLMEGLVRWNEDRALSASSGVPCQQQTYSGIVRHSVNKLSEDVFGRALIHYREPRKYTGELVGVQYLYRQTGEVLQDLAMDEEKEEKEMAEEDFEEVDEGFIEDSIEDETIGSVEEVVKTSEAQTLAPTKKLIALPISMEDSIVEPPETIFKDIKSIPNSPPATTAQTRTATQSRSSELTGEDESVGPDNIEGYGRVQDLANYLASLRDQTAALTNQQAVDIIRLWDALGDFDKQATKFSPRHKKTNPCGRFKSPKSKVAPGVLSTKRCFLGANSGPAQWPDCNRYVEALVSKLCEFYPSPVKSNNKTFSRWTQISRAYKRIRQMVLDNALAIRSTAIQLVEINQATLTQWYNKRGKKQEREMLQQGISLSQPPMTSSRPLPKARTQSGLLEIPEGNIHQFDLPENTSGTAKVRRRLYLDDNGDPKPPSPTYPPSMLPMTVTPPAQSTPIMVYVTPQGMMGVPQQFLSKYVQQHSSKVPHLPQPTVSGSLPPAPLVQSVQIPPPSQTLSASSIRYRKRKLAKVLAGDSTVTYKPRTTVFKCKECGHDRIAPHRSFFCNWYCPEKAKKSFEEWKEDLKNEKGYGSRKKRLSRDEV